MSETKTQSVEESIAFLKGYVLTRLANGDRIKEFSSEELFNPDGTENFEKTENITDPVAKAFARHFDEINYVDSFDRMAAEAKFLLDQLAAGDEDEILNTQSERITFLTEHLQRTLEARVKVMSRRNRN